MVRRRRADDDTAGRASLPVTHTSRSHRPGPAESAPPRYSDRFGVSRFTVRAMNSSMSCRQAIGKVVDRFASLGLSNKPPTRRRSRLWTAVSTPVPWAGALILGSAVAGGVWADGGDPADVTNDAIMWGLAVAFVASMWTATRLQHGPAAHQPEVTRIRLLSLYWWAAATIAVGAAVTIFPASAGAPAFGWAFLAAAPVGGLIIASMLSMAALGWGSGSPQRATNDGTPAVSC